MEDAPGKLAQERLSLEELECYILNRPGIVQQTGDVSFRLDTQSADTSELEDDKPGSLLAEVTTTKAVTVRICEQCEGQDWNQPMYPEVQWVAHVSI